MSGRTLQACAALASCVALTGGAALLGAGARAAAAVAAPPGASATVSAAPPSVRFGDPFTLRAEVRVPDGTGAGAGTPGGAPVALLDPAPFTALAPARSSSRHEDGATVITVSVRAACLAAACVPGPKGRTVLAGAVSVRAGATTSAVRGAGVQVRVTGRVPDALARSQSGGYRVDASAPRRTWGVAPGTLAALLLVGAAALVLGALALLWPDAAGRLAARARPADVDPFRRALRLLRESAQRSAPDRRRAADLVARLTGARGDVDASEGALRLAWDRPEPEPADAIGLADRAERGEGAAT